MVFLRSAFGKLPFRPISFDQFHWAEDFQQISFGRRHSADFGMFAECASITVNWLLVSI